MLLAAQFLATILYLVPLIVLATIRSHRERPLWAFALDIPLAVSVDLLSILALTWFVRLELAVLLSRLLWVLIGSCIWWARGRRRPELPPAFDRHTALAVSLAAGAAYALGTVFSRATSAHDRHWHIPLVSSLRAQKLPFHNVFDFDPDLILHYHFSGDVLAAEFQTLTFGTIHSSLALSLAHDVVFALIGASFALLLISFTSKRKVSVIAGILALLLNGPLPLMRGKVGTPTFGYSWLTFYDCSFRPHVSLAGLLYVGILGSISARLLSRPNPNARAQLKETLPVLLASTALLSITDEASTAQFGLVLGLTWLFAPDIIAPRRWQGILTLAGLLGLITAANLGFSASLVPGGPVQKVARVAWRSPGYISPPLLLSTPEGRTALLFDIAPLLVVVGCLAFTSLRSRKMAFWPLAVFIGALSVLSVGLLTGIEINHSPLEGHRFMIFAGFAGCFWAVLLYGSLPLGSAARYAQLTAIILVSASSIDWIRNVSLTAQSYTIPPIDVLQVDCRKEAGFRLGEAISPAYISEGWFYRFAGCRPILSQGEKNGWNLGLSPLSAQQSFRALHIAPRMFGKSLEALCPETATPDSVCSYAQSHGLCQRQGSLLWHCILSASERDSLLAPKP